jgi:hypothetical protein
MRRRRMEEGEEGRNTPGHSHLLPVIRNALNKFSKINIVCYVIVVISEIFSLALFNSKILKSQLNSEVLIEHVLCTQPCSGWDK